MTDLISTLADQLVALNNASPRSPTKAEIEDVLRKGDPQIAALLRISIDSGMFASFPGFLYHGSPGTEGDADAGGITSLTVPQDDRMAEIMPLPYKPLSIELAELMRLQSEAWLAAASAGIHPEATPKSTLPCPKSADASHHNWECDPDRRPGTADCDVNVLAPLRCACGAVKPYPMDTKTVKRRKRAPSPKAPPSLWLAPDVELSFTPCRTTTLGKGQPSFKLTMSKSASRALSIEGVMEREHLVEWHTVLGELLAATR